VHDGDLEPTRGNVCGTQTAVAWWFCLQVHFVLFPNLRHYSHVSVGDGGSKTVASASGEAKERVFKIHVTHITHEIYTRMRTRMY
jgi:hypothetical protein